MLPFLLCFNQLSAFSVLCILKTTVHVLYTAINAAASRRTTYFTAANENVTIFLNNPYS